jgi:hypothetical protein
LPGTKLIRLRGPVPCQIPRPCGHFKTDEDHPFVFAASIANTVSMAEGFPVLMRLKTKPHGSQVSRDLVRTRYKRCGCCAAKTRAPTSISHLSVGYIAFSRPGSNRRAASTDSRFPCLPQLPASTLLPRLYAKNAAVCASLRACRCSSSSSSACSRLWDCDGDDHNIYHDRLRRPSRHRTRLLALNSFLVLVPIVKGRPFPHPTLRCHTRYTPQRWNSSMRWSREQADRM